MSKIMLGLLLFLPFVAEAASSDDSDPYLPQGVFTVPENTSAIGSAITLGVITINPVETLVLQSGDALPQPQVLGLGLAFQQLPETMPIQRGVVAEYEVVVGTSPSIIGKPEAFMIVRSDASGNQVFTADSELVIQ